MTDAEKQAMAEQLRKQYGQYGIGGPAPTKPMFFATHEDAHAHGTSSARDLYYTQFDEMFTAMFTAFLSSWPVRK